MFEVFLKSKRTFYKRPKPTTLKILNIFIQKFRWLRGFELKGHRFWNFFDNSFLRFSFQIQNDSRIWTVFSFFVLKFTFSFKPSLLCRVFVLRWREYWVDIKFFWFEVEFEVFIIRCQWRISAGQLNALLFWDEMSANLMCFLYIKLRITERIKGLLRKFLLGWPKGTVSSL